MFFQSWLDQTTVNLWWNPECKSATWIWTYPWSFACWTTTLSGWPAPIPDWRPASWRTTGTRRCRVPPCPSRRISAWVSDPVHVQIRLYVEVEQYNLSMPAPSSFPEQAAFGCQVLVESLLLARPGCRAVFTKFTNHDFSSGIMGG